ncbi:hypothetical protein SynMITS9220_01379 [Synechococcus sp. MIT S9220]|nr:hypothetical protein SynMITS9220_01379 [Synechococcus sp. MIT S9220]
MAEWLMAIVLIHQYKPDGQTASRQRIAWAMLPALVSAMAACTWHLYDNAEELRWLVTLQASFTLIGNAMLAWAAWSSKAPTSLEDQI